MRAIIVGGSMAGLFAGLLLRRAGWDVDIYERSGPSVADRGAGIVTHPRLLHDMKEAGTSWKGELGVTVSGRRVLAQDGQVTNERSMPQLVSSWSRLYGVLRHGFPAARYHHNTSLITFEQSSGSVGARLSDGTQMEADLLIAADGVHSTVRSLLLPGVAPSYVGYIAWRGVVPEHELSSSSRELLMSHFSFCLPAGEQMLGYPIAGPETDLSSGARLYNFVWYRPADAEQELRRLLTDRNGKSSATGLAPDLMRPEVITEIRATAERLLAPPFAEVVRIARQPFLQPIVDLAVERMIGGRVVLIGDAAFVARPHAGMGVTKAAADAATLSGALQESPHDLGKALANFESRQLSAGRAIVERGRRLGAYMQAQVRSPEEKRAAEEFRSPEAILSETAVDVQC